MVEILYTIIIYPITQILEFAFFFSQKLFKESGISIIFISLVISVLCLPLYAVAEKWQQLDRDTGRRLKPKIDKIKKVFKGDEQYMILSAYYRQNHYHPIYVLRGSFGLLIQIPFFIAAYSYLSHLEVIKSVSFLFIKDLGKPDALISTGGFTVNLLPFIMTFINCLTGAVYTKGLPAIVKVQLYGMAGIFLILLYNSPSALVLYWTMNNLFSLVKNIYYRIKIKHKSLLLLVLFSVCCISLAVFCISKYYYITKAQKLVFVCFFTAIVPWIFVVFKKQLLGIVDIAYDNKKTLAAFLLSLFLVWAVFGLFIPSQLIVSSSQEFSFIDEYTNPLIFIFFTALQSAGMFLFWPICLYLLFSNNVKKYFSVAFLAISFGILVNIFLFPGNYGIISVNLVYTSSPGHSGREILLNLGVLLIPLAAAYVLYNIKSKNVVMTVIFLCIFSLLSISILNIYKINASFNELNKYYVKQEKEVHQVSPLFLLSRKGKNIVVIMLDRAVNVFIPFIFEESPELKEKYAGFIFYPNTVSFNGYTRIGSPPVFGGYEYTPEEINKRDHIPLMEKHNQSLIMLPRILFENDFSVCVTDPPYANYNQKSDLSIFANYPDIKAHITDSRYTDTWLMEHDLKLPKTGSVVKRNMLWYSLLKGLPLLFRQPVYMDGTWCSPTSGNRLRLTLNGYSVLDYLPRLTDITDELVNTALIMTNNTTHEGSFLQAPDYVPMITATNMGNTRFAKEHSYHVNAAAIKRLSDWFDFMKKENVYDNTKIILVSDHGPEPNYITKIGLPFNVDQFNPLLMVKDFNASGDIKTNMAFMSNADVPHLSLVGVIDNPINPFTGNKISVDRKKSPLYIAISGSIHLSDSTDTQFQLNSKIDYYVHDNIFIAENWIPVTEKK